MTHTFSTTLQLLDTGIHNGWHTGGQLYVSRHGQTLLDHAFGDARPGHPMQPGTLLQWFSAGKPITAIAIAQLTESGQLALENPVAQYLPDFATLGKESIQLRHLLNHTSGLRLADKLPAGLPWDEMIRRICQTRLEPDWVPGEKAGYSTQAAWFILGEIVRRVTGQPLDLYVREKIFAPVGMHNTWLSLPPGKYEEYGEPRLGLLYEKKENQFAPIIHQDKQGMALLRPGSSARGPVRELGLFYQVLLQGGVAKNGQQILKPETIRLFTTPHRVGLYDHTFFHTLDFGFGFLLDSNRYGVETVPYGYGRHSSPETFGHSGAQSSCGFADPAHQLVVAWVMNGLPGERPHQQRVRALNSAIYQDLRLA